jgi:hypothetical protein
MSAKLFELASLADAIGAVREEVIRAQMQGQGEELSFQVGPVEMEFEVTLTRSASYGGLKVLVITDDVSDRELGGGTRSDVTTHRVRLTLEPVTHAGADVTISAVGR